MNYPDPFERMAGEDVDGELRPLFAKQRARSVLVSIRMPEELLVRVKRLAQARETRYQTLIKRMLDKELSRIEQEGLGSLKEAANARGEEGAEPARP
jgi:predicted transcriptional regulator